MKLVLDASVAIKLYAAEDDSALALESVSRATSIAVPDIFLVEVAQALLRHVREGRLSRGELEEAIRELDGLTEVPCGSGILIESAVDFAQMFPHGLHDCIYLALAAREDRTLLTADGAFYRKVRGMKSPPSILLLAEVG